MRTVDFPQSVKPESIQRLEIGKDFVKLWLASGSLLVWPNRHGQTIYKGDVSPGLTVGGVGKEGVMRFQALCDRYLSDRCQHLSEASLTRYDFVITSLCQSIDKLPRPGDREQKTLRDSVTAWQIKRRAALSPRSFNIELGMLKEILSYAVDEGLLARNPVAGVKGQKVSRNILPVPTPEQYRDLLAWLQSHHRPTADYIELLALTGFRRSEAQALLWRDVDFAANTIRVYRIKTQLEQVLNMSKDLENFLLGLFDAVHPQPEDRVVSANSARYWTRRAAEALNQPVFSDHAYRRYFATEMVKLYGLAQIDCVAELLGHSDHGSTLLKSYSARARQALAIPTSGNTSRASTTPRPEPATS